MIRFPLNTPLATVVGMVKVVCDKLHNVEKVHVDRTGYGLYVTAQNAKIRSRIQGVVLPIQRKQEILGYMKNLMEQQTLAIYYDPDLISEINTEQYQLTKSGQIQFSHPEGAHDDRLWVLATYATRTPDTSYMGIGYGVTRN